MADPKRTLNNRRGGHVAEPRFRGITANPNGNREERRAAKKLGVAKVIGVTRPVFDLAIPDDELNALIAKEETNL
jgi:hypothetical protein